MTSSNIANSCLVIHTIAKKLYRTGPRAKMLPDDYAQEVFQLSRLFWDGDLELDIPEMGEDDEARAEAIMAWFDKWLRFNESERADLWQMINEKCRWRKQGRTWVSHTGATRVWRQDPRTEDERIRDRQQKGNNRRQLESNQRIRLVFFTLLKQNDQVPSIRKLSRVARCTESKAKEIIQQIRGESDLRETERPDYKNSVPPNPRFKGTEYDKQKHNYLEFKTRERKSRIMEQLRSWLVQEYHTHLVQEHRLVKNDPRSIKIRIDLRGIAGQRVSEFLKSIYANIGVRVTGLAFQGLNHLYAQVVQKFFSFIKERGELVLVEPRAEKPPKPTPCDRKGVVRVNRKWKFRALDPQTYLDLCRQSLTRIDEHIPAPKKTAPDYSEATRSVLDNLLGLLKRPAPAVIGPVG